MFYKLTLLDSSLVTSLCAVGQSAVVVAKGSRVEYWKTPTRSTDEGDDAANSAAGTLASLDETKLVRASVRDLSSEVRHLSCSGDDLILALCVCGTVVGLRIVTESSCVLMVVEFRASRPNQVATGMGSALQDQLTAPMYVFPFAAAEGGRSFATLDTVGHLVFYAPTGGTAAEGEDESMGIYGEAHGKTEELVRMDKIADQSNLVVFDAKPLAGASGLACLAKWQATDGSERIEEGVVRYMWDADQSQSVTARSVQDSAFCEPVADGRCAVATTGSALVIVDFATPESDPTIIPLPTGASATALLAFRDGFMCVLTSGAVHIYSSSEGLSSAVMALDATQPVRMMTWVPTLDSAVALCGDGPQLLRLLNPVTGEIPPEYAIENQDEEMASLGPITDLKMVSMLDRQATSQTALPDGTTAIGSPNGSNGVAPGHCQPACLVLSGRGQHSQLRALGYGVGMLKLGSTPLPGRATAIFTIEDEVRTKYMLISFVDVTLVLQLTSSGVAEVPPGEAEFVTGLPTVFACQGVQVTPAECKLVPRGGDWHPPRGCRIAAACWDGGSLILVALADGEVRHRGRVVGLAVDAPGLVNEVGSFDTDTEIMTVSAANGLVALCTRGSKVALYRYEEQQQGAGGQLSFQALTVANVSSTVESLHINCMGGLHSLYLGLTNGVLMKYSVDPDVGSLGRQRSRFLGPKPVRQITTLPDETTVALGASLFICRAAASPGEDWCVPTTGCGVDVPVFLAPYVTEACPTGGVVYICDQDAGSSSMVLGSLLLPLDGHWVGFHDLLKPVTLGRTGRRIVVLDSHPEGEPGEFVIAVLARNSAAKGTADEGGSVLHLVGGRTFTMLATLKFASNEECLCICPVVSKTALVSQQPPVLAVGIHRRGTEEGEADSYSIRLYTYFELEPAPMTHRRYEVQLAKEQPTEAAIITMTGHGDGAGLLVSLANGTVALYNFRDRLQVTRQSWIKTEPPIWLHCEHDDKCPDRVYSAARSRGGLQLHGIRTRDWSIQPLCREFGGQLGAQFAAACVFDRDTVIVGDKRGGLTTMRVPGHIAADEKSDLAGYPMRMPLEISACFEPLAHITLGCDIPTALCAVETSLLGALPQCVVYATVRGSIGVLVPLPDHGGAMSGGPWKQQAQAGNIESFADSPQFLSYLEGLFRSCVCPTRPSQRQPLQPPSAGVIDGDMCEQLIGLDGSSLNPSVQRALLEAGMLPEGEPQSVADQIAASLDNLRGVMATAAFRI